MSEGQTRQKPDRKRTPIWM